jgi:hypothetical protein
MLTARPSLARHHKPFSDAQDTEEEKESAGSACCLFMTTMLLSGGFLQWCLAPQQFDIVSVVVHVLVGASEEALSTRPLQNTAGRTKNVKKRVWGR